MKKNVYDNNISPKCAYCEKGKLIEGESIVLCKNSGVMRADSCCKKFKYDPLKRKPQTQNIMQGFSKEDFEL